jgi:hypothetical protein
VPVRLALRNDRPPALGKAMSAKPESSEWYEEFWRLQKEMPDFVRGKLHERRKWVMMGGIIGYIIAAVIIDQVIGAYCRRCDGPTMDIIVGVLFFGSIPMMMFCFGWLPDKLMSWSERKEIEYRMEMGDWRK